MQRPRGRKELRDNLGAQEGGWEIVTEREKAQCKAAVLGSQVTWGLRKHRRELEFSSKTPKD